MKKEKAISRLIRQFLEQEEMTAKELAETLNIAESTVHRWLRGQATPTGTAASILWTLISLSRDASTTDSSGETSLDADQQDPPPSEEVMTSGGTPTDSAELSSDVASVESLVSGHAIYRLLKRFFEYRRLSNEAHQAAEDELRARLKRQRQKEKVEMLKDKLKAEEKRLEEFGPDRSGRSVILEIYDDELFELVSEEVNKVVDNEDHRKGG